MKLLLGFKGRVLSAGICIMGLAAMTPAGAKSPSAFLSSPAGLGSFAALAIAAGVTVEETGTLRRIRLGIALRLAAAAMLLLAVLWAGWLGAPSSSLATLGWALIAAGGIPVVYATRLDAAAYDDPRSGQSLRLQSISPDALRLSVEGLPVIIPTSLLRGAELAESDTGRGVFILVADRDRATGNVHALPWVASNASGDVFFLTEHQAALDADTLLMQILDATRASHEKGYR